MLNTPNSPAVIVDPYSSGAFYASAFSAVGVPVVGVMTAPEPPDVYAPSFRPQDFEEILVADAGDLSPLVSRLKDLNPRCVLTGCESGVELTDQLAPQVMGSVANPVDKAEARRDKGEMAKAVADANLPRMRQICTNDVNEVEDWYQRENLEGKSLVIKPPKSASTDGVVKIPKGTDWKDKFNELIGTNNRLGGTNDKLVVQEFLEGVEYAVDTASFDGTHSVASICRYNKIDNGPFMAIYDTMEWMSPSIPEYQQLVDYAFDVLDAVGMHYGSSHVEIMLTEDGPRLIEIGARPHGGGHPQFCRHATGDSQVDRVARCFAEKGLLKPGYELATNMMIVFLMCKRGGTVTNAKIMEKIPALDSYFFSKVNISDGDVLEPTKDLFASLDLGFVALAHTDKNQIQADYDLIRSIEQQLID